jgi:hypothetical protein
MRATSLSQHTLEAVRRGGRVRHATLRRVIQALSSRTPNAAHQQGRRRRFLHRESTLQKLAETAMYARYTSDRRRDLIPPPRVPVLRH